ncbi:retrovirus-related pol polyprotein from transposon TNT 1-94 [Tanacetum coccineum]
MDNSKRGLIPMQERLDLNKSQGAQTPKEVNRMKNVPYASVVGSIMNASGVSVNKTLFRGMIWSLLYLTASRLVSNSPHVSVPGSGFNLKAYSDSDYARCNLDRKSTSGGCQILGGKLVFWSAKKQSSIAMSSAKAEYVVAAGCCA